MGGGWGTPAEGAGWQPRVLLALLGPGLPLLQVTTSSAKDSAAMIGVKQGPRAEAGRPSGFRGTPSPVQLSLEDVNRYKRRGGGLKINKQSRRHIRRGKKRINLKKVRGKKELIKATAEVNF